MHQGYTPSHIAVNYLISNDANIERKTGEGCIPLYIGSEQNHIEIVKSLISAHANLEISSIFGTTSLYMIKFYQYLGII